MSAYVGGVRIAHHAAERYCERVDQRLTADAATVEIGKHERAIRVAIEFGCRTVKLGCGARLIIENETVVTVLGVGQYPSRDRATA